MSLKEYKEEYMESFGGKKGKEKMMQMYYNLEKYRKEIVIVYLLKHPKTKEQ